MRQSRGTESARSDAKRIVAGLINVANDRFPGKDRLFKAFYYAHRYFWHKHGRLLTEWPVVKMHRGPGIEDHRRLIAEMESEGFFELTELAIGEELNPIMIFVGRKKVSLHPDEEVALELAWEKVRDKNSYELSEMSHGDSRTWRSYEMGEPLDIELDAMSELEWERNERRLMSAAAQLENVAGL